MTAPKQANRYRESRFFQLAILSPLLALALIRCSSGPSIAEHDTPENVKLFHDFASTDLNRSIATTEDSIEVAPRKGDPARRYIIEAGSLFRVLNANERCLVSAGVKSMKHPEHPQDSAYLYFVQDRDLFGLYPDSNSRRGLQHCGSVEKKQLVSNVLKTGTQFSYQTQGHPDSEIVLLALTDHQNFRAWNPERMIWEKDGVESFRLNPCFRQKNRKDHEVMAFLTTGEGGKILRMPPKRAPAGTLNIETVGDVYYADLMQYVDKEGICRLK